MSRTLLAFAMAGLGSLFPIGLSGQAPTPLTPGQTVRIRKQNGFHRTGVLRAITSDSITFESPYGLPPISYAMADVSTIEEKTESYTSPRTILIAMGITSATGGLFGLFGGASCNGEFLCPGPAAGLAFGALAGAVVGLPIGLVLWPIIRYSRWEPVAKPVSHPRLGLGFSVKIPLPAW